jgi:hypothetical protein
MAGSQSVAGENVKCEDRERGDADCEIKNVKHANDLLAAHGGHNQSIDLADLSSA